MNDEASKAAEWAELAENWHTVRAALSKRINAKLLTLTSPISTETVEQLRQIQGWLECAQWVLTMPDSEIRRLQETKKKEGTKPSTTVP